MEFCSGRSGLIYCNTLMSNFLMDKTPLISLKSICYEMFSNTLLTSCHKYKLPVKFTDTVMNIICRFFTGIFYGLSPDKFTILCLRKMHINPATKRPRPHSSHRISTTQNKANKSSNSSSSSSSTSTIKAKRTSCSELARENKYKDSVCIMCSDTVKTRRHHHFSSTSVKRMLFSQHQTTYMCPMCQTPGLLRSHPPRLEGLSFVTAPYMECGPSPLAATLSILTLIALWEERCRISPQP